MALRSPTKTNGKQKTEESPRSLEEQKKKLQYMESKITMKMYELDAALIQINEKVEQVESIKYQLEESLEAFKNNAKVVGQEQIMINYENLSNRCSDLEKKVGKRDDEEEKFTVEEIRKTPWVAVPEDYEVKCIWSRCERNFTPSQYCSGRVICPYCNRQTPIHKPPEGKKWIYFWNCWHIHPVSPETTSDKCWKCGMAGEMKESNIRLPVKKK